MADLHARTLFLAVAGSRAQGLHRPDSDVDLRGVATPTAAQLLGYRESFAQADTPERLAPFAAHLRPDERAVAASTKLEGSVYALAKFVRLAADANPSILEALFCRDEEVRLCTPLGERLRSARRATLSIRVAESFSGYAQQQLRRIQGHRRWLQDPPAGPPDRAALDLPGQPSPKPSAAEAALERAFARDSRTWSNFQTWQRRRNPDRAALEAAHGYDTKHGAHLVRLLRMGREIVETGEVHVWRGGRDAEELQAIRAGAWSYERLSAWADAELAAVRDVAEPAVPEQPDHDALDGLVVELHQRALAGER
jgi:predicted nucleotidyltransferase